MSNEYMRKLYDGEDASFSQFALRCARAFGMLIEMYDEPLDADIPDHFEASNLHLEQLGEAKERLAEVRAWDANTAEEKAIASHKETVAELLARNKLSVERRERYNAMLTEVLAWRPPTADHQELRTFMIQQLESGIEHDCREIEIPPPLSGKDYRAKEIEQTQRVFEYYQEQHAKELELASSRTQWVRQLWESLSE